MFAANVVFEPLVGEMFRSNLVQQAAAGNGDFVTPTIIGAGEYDYAQRDLRMTIAMFEPRASDKEFAAHNKEVMQGWLDEWVPVSLEAGLKLQPIWSQPSEKVVRFEDSLQRSKQRFGDLLEDLTLETPKVAKAWA